MATAEYWVNGRKVSAAEWLASAKGERSEGLADREAVHAIVLGAIGAHMKKPLGGPRNPSDSMTDYLIANRPAVLRALGAVEVVKEWEEPTHLYAKGPLAGQPLVAIRHRQKRLELNEPWEAADE